MAQQQFVDVSQVMAMFSDAKGLVDVNAENALTKAGDATARAVEAKIEPRFRSSVKAKVWRVRKYKSGLTFGIFRGQHGGHQNPKYSVPMDDWMKAYWKNYGTYGQRAPGHRFKKARRPATAGVQGGEKPRKFYEKATRNWKRTFLREFEKAFKAQTL